MISTTFKHLPEVKKEKITQALLTEFSHYPLAKAQVTRIVKEAQIARGAFYKYFTNLDNAYQYLYYLALKAIHLNIDFKNNGSNPNIYVKAVHDFLLGTLASKYKDFIKMDLFENNVTDKLVFNANDQLNNFQWGAMVLSHKTIKDALKQPHYVDKYLTRLTQLLNQLAKNS